MPTDRLVRPRTAVPIHLDDDTVFRFGSDELREATAGATDLTAIRWVDRGEPWRFPLPR